MGIGSSAWTSRNPRHARTDDLNLPIPGVVTSWVQPRDLPLRADPSHVMSQPLIAQEVANQLCPSDRTRLFAQGENLLSLTNRSELTDCLDGLRSWLELNEIVVATETVDKLPDACVTGSGYNPEWMELYMREGFVSVDPIVQGIIHGQRFLNRSRMAFHGQPLAERGAAGTRLARFLEAAHDYGRSRYGFACGIVFNGRVALCSVTTSRDQHERRASLVMCALRPLMYQALMRIFLPEPAFPSLSQREYAILEYLASGFGDTQIAGTLSISESTVRFHLGNVFDKLGARNRCHAVAIGFQTGLLPR